MNSGYADIQTRPSIPRDKYCLFLCKGRILNSYFGPINRVAKFCDRVGDSARALRIAAIKKA